MKYFHSVVASNLDEAHRVTSEKKKAWLKEGKEEKDFDWEEVYGWAHYEARKKKMRGFGEEKVGPRKEGQAESEWEEMVREAGEAEYRWRDEKVVIELCTEAEQSRRFSYSMV